MAKKRNKYTEEFKRDAVRLMRNRSERTVAQVADDLGVPTNQRKCAPSPVVNSVRGRAKRGGRQLCVSCQGSSASPRSAARAASRRYRAGSTLWSFAVSTSV